MRAIARPVIFVFLGWLLLPAPVQAQRIDIQAVNRKYQSLYAKGDYAAALVEARKLENAVRAFGGTEHPNYPIVLEFVGNSLMGLGRFSEAEQSHRRVLALRESLYGNESTQAADSYLNLGNAILRQGRYSEAEQSYRRAMEIQRKNGATETSTTIAELLENVSIALEAQGKNQSAQNLLQRVLAVHEKEFGSKHPKVADTISKLATLEQKSGRIRQAETLFRRALQVQSGDLQNPLPAARTLNNLGILHASSGQHGEAEVEFREALAIQERRLGGNHPAVAEVIQNLAAVLKSQCRYDDAEALNKRVIAIREATLGSRHPDLASTLINLGNIYVIAQKFSEADALYQRALTIQEQALGNAHPNIAFVLHNMAYAAEAQNRFNEAETLSRQAIRLHEQALGPNNPETAKALIILGNVLAAQRRFQEAQAAYERALAIYSDSLGAQHPDYAVTAYNIARAYAGRGDIQQSLRWSREAASSLIAAGARSAQNQIAGESCLVQQRSGVFTHMAEQARLALQRKLGPTDRLTDETFEMIQWANHSTSASALQQMALRFAGGNNELAVLVRESQDLVSRLRERDKALLAALSRPASDQTSEVAQRIRSEIEDIQTRFTQAQARLNKDFPDYAALTNPRPLPSKDVRGFLRPDEVMIVWSSGEKQTELFALTRENIEWHSLPLSADMLAKKVAAFRQGLDVDALAKAETDSATRLFDLAGAFELHNELFGPVKNLIKSKRHILAVPSGPLTAVPFHALVTEPSATPQTTSDMEAYRTAAWLIHQNAISVLPSVSSLKSLRALASNNRAEKPLIGFGDPVFQPPARPQPAGKQRAQKQAPASKANTRPAVKTRAYSEFWQGANVDRARLSDALPPLPDTADELREIAARLNVDRKDVLLGTAANETNLKSMPLGDYRIVYFATHGLVAGDVKGVTEPSLALTIPAVATPHDDGLLTASEIAQLKLNADWVILSACNTAAGEKPGADALSGLARSFFYAGARALLVSHWAVASDAATALTTATFAKLSSDSTMGRAEALRRAMVEYVQDQSKPQNAYPAMWAPFVVVGEGAFN